MSISDVGSEARQFRIFLYPRWDGLSEIPDGQMQITRLQITQSPVEVVLGEVWIGL